MGSEVNKMSSLLSAKKSLLLVVDLQESLLAVIPGEKEIIKNSEKAIEAASWLEIPILVSEQYPKGLGGTHPKLQELVKKTPKLEKTTFSLCGVDKFKSYLPKLKGKYVVIIGVEAHICVLQTAIELLEQAECKVYVVSDAVGSRKSSDRDLALKRMSSHGVEIISTEMLLMEWMRDSRHKDFKLIQGMIK